jgi:KaiC/GvpD/RAD55 family RecA-like ATPase
MRKYSQPKSEKSINIPAELLQFVKKDTYSLVIKGAAGTGKTTLSLTILKALDIKSNFFYICTRVSPRQLSMTYPWITKYVESQKERMPGPSSSETEVPINFEDARLDEPESLFERITNELMDVKSPLIIIDSWDAVASFMDREARLNNERVLQTWRERAGAKLIFVNEDPVYTSLESVVDGAIRLDKVDKGNVRFREISLLKLRGIRISKPSYLFTLNKSSFRSFQTFNPRNFWIEPDSAGPIHFKNSIRNKPFTLLEQGHIKSGYDDLDLNLEGGFPRRAVVVLEVGQNVSKLVAMVFLFRVIQMFLASGNVVFFEPPNAIGSIGANRFTKSCLSVAQSGSGKFFRVGPQFGNVASSVDRDRNPKENFLSFLSKSITKEQQNNPNKLMLCVLSQDHFQSPDTHILLEHLLQAKQTLDLSIIISSESFAWSPDIVDLSMKIVVVNGTLILRTLYPFAPILAIEVEKRFGLPLANLTPLV